MYTQYIHLYSQKYTYYLSTTSWHKLSSMYSVHVVSISMLNIYSNNHQTWTLYNHSSMVVQTYRAREVAINPHIIFLFPTTTVMYMKITWRLPSCTIPCSRCSPYLAPLLDNDVVRVGHFTLVSKHYVHTIYTSLQSELYYYLSTTSWHGHLKLVRMTFFPLASYFRIPYTYMIMLILIWSWFSNYKPSISFIRKARGRASPSCEHASAHNMR